MPWLALLSAENPTPADNILNPVITAVLGYGVTGVALLILAWLMFRGWRLTSPAMEAAARASAREEGRSDLLRENEHLAAKLEQTEAQRDEALKVAQTELVPLLLTFNGTVSSLLPILQDLVSRHDSLNRRSR